MYNINYTIVGAAVLGSPHILILFLSGRSGVRPLHFSNIFHPNFEKYSLIKHKYKKENLDKFSKLSLIYY